MIYLSSHLKRILFVAPRTSVVLDPDFPNPNIDSTRFPYGEKPFGDTVTRRPKPSKQIHPLAENPDRRTCCPWVVFWAAEISSVAWPMAVKSGNDAVRKSQNCWDRQISHPTTTTHATRWFHCANDLSKKSAVPPGSFAQLFADRQFFG